VNRIRISVGAIRVGMTTFERNPELFVLHVYLRGSLMMQDYCFLGHLDWEVYETKYNKINYKIVHFYFTL
jgi:hypothetical protein